MYKSNTNFLILELKPDVMHNHVDNETEMNKFGLQGLISESPFPKIRLQEVQR